jgi:hypothetical protein
MAAQLILRLASQVGSPVGNLQVRYVNTTNTPILSVAWLDSGVAIADDYTLTVLTKNGSALTVKVEANVKNPYVSLTGLPATADGTTVNKTLIPGIGIVLSASADVGWAAKVTVGDYMDAGGAITHVGVFGVVQSGQVTTGVRVAAVNVGDAPAQNTVLYALPGGFYFGSGYEVLIQTIKPHSDPSRTGERTAARARRRPMSRSAAPPRLSARSSMGRRSTSGARATGTSTTSTCCPACSSCSRTRRATRAP